MQHATCTLPDCGKPHEAKGYCKTHYQRWLRTGDPYPRCRTCGTVVSSSKRHYCSDDCKPRCSVEGCESPQRKMGWCAAHYANHQQGREVKPFAYKWAEKGQPCQVCGEPTGSFRSRKYCSANCNALAARHGEVPKVASCVHCGIEFDLFERGPSGRKRRSDITQCQRCRRSLLKHGHTPSEIVERDGLGCAICGNPVDLSLMSPDHFRVSIDHIIPTALGGTSDLSNLQLAHLWCNQVKNKRKGFVI